MPDRARDAGRCGKRFVEDFPCQTYVGGRGLATGHVFDAAGVHVATIAQEVLLRDSRER
jgi:acyl-CoA thioesterase II